MGSALAIALSGTGYTVENLFYRSVPHDELLQNLALAAVARKIGQADRVESDIVLITTSDTEIVAAAGAFAPLLKSTAVVLHTSGSLSSSVLSAAAENGNPTGSMHPLVSVSSPAIGAASFEGAFFCLEGAEAAVMASEEIVRSLGGRAFSIAAELKPLYHASAVLASGHIVALFEAARETLTACGVDSGFAREVLRPLVESTIKNLSERSPEAALTGPFARADLGTIERHLDAFQEADLDLQERIYLELGSIALELAERSNAPHAEVERIRERIKLALAPAK
jgi:predicted short-subunit dehydrogenase-like oxidoreductase (DUF2520 family)